MKFTKQQFIPGKASSRIEQDAIARYEFTCQFVKDKNVLDMACGVGYGSHMLSGAGARVDGVDISKEAIDYAQTNYPGINFLVADALSYIPDKKYGVIASHVTIEQINDHGAVLERFYKWLTPDGLLIISSPNKKITSPTNVLHSFNAREFTTGEFVDELKKIGFKITGVYGQRFQRYFKNRYLSRIYKKLFKPDHNSSPAISEIKTKLEPRYFVITAKK